jgi:hypothetical protein
MINDGMIRLECKDFETAYKLADAVVSCHTCVNKEGGDVKTPETVAAQSIMDNIDQARDSKQEFLIFTENEVICLAAVFS